MAPKPLSSARLRAFRITCLAVGILCLGGSLQVQAQTSSAAITGTIRDETGAVIPAAGLELTNIETGITVRSASNSVGNYNFLNILPGSYHAGRHQGRLPHGRR